MEGSPKKRSFNSTRKSSSASDKKKGTVSGSRSGKKSVSPRREFHDSDSSGGEKRKYIKSRLGNEERPRRTSSGRERKHETQSDSRGDTNFRRKYGDSENYSPKRRYTESSGTGRNDADYKRSSPGRDNDSRRKYGKSDDYSPKRRYTESSGTGRSDADYKRSSSGRDNDSRRKYGETDDYSAKKRYSGSRREDADRGRSSRREYTNRSEDSSGPRRFNSSKDDRQGSGTRSKSFRKYDNDDRPYPKDKRNFNESSDFTPKRRRRDVTAESAILTEIVEKRRREGRSSPQKQKILSLEYEEQYGPIRLNKYISNSGICSRRDADMLIASGAITINGKIVTELGTKVMPTDEVRYGDKVLQREKPVYVLLNKPKDYITTTYDERERKDVMELLRGACKERIYPVGRLDKNTTGLLLFTNDGEMAKKLTHPKHKIQKIYHVELSKNLSGSDFESIANGFDLDDGFIQPDEISYVNDSKKEIGIAIHSGRNRIVRRIFEKYGYEVEKLDRVVFAGLTKKNLPRGKWRFLTEAEINILKMLK